MKQIWFENWCVLFMIHFIIGDLLVNTDFRVQRTEICLQFVQYINHKMRFFPYIDTVTSINWESLLYYYYTMFAYLNIFFSLWQFESYDTTDKISKWLYHFQGDWTDSFQTPRLIPNNLWFFLQKYVIYFLKNPYDLPNCMQIFSFSRDKNNCLSRQI